MMTTAISIRLMYTTAGTGVRNQVAACMMMMKYAAILVRTEVRLMPKIMLKGL